MTYRNRSDPKIGAVSSKSTTALVTKAWSMLCKLQAAPGCNGLEMSLSRWPTHSLCLPDCLAALPSLQLGLSESDPQ